MGGSGEESGREQRLEKKCMTLLTDGEEDFIQEAPLCQVVQQGGEIGLNSKQNKGTWGFPAKEQSEGQGIIENYCGNIKARGILARGTGQDSC